MHIGTRTCLFGSGTVLAIGSYSKVRLSLIYSCYYSRAVEVGSSATGRVVMVKLGLAIGRAVRVCSFSCRRSSKC
jgi:hypothetical protein